ncbi:MAG: hypothetical protein WBE47_15655 [Candidatus Acidiferrales bacterium]
MIDRWASAALVHRQANRASTIPASQRQQFEITERVCLEMIVKKALNEWRAQGDDLRTFLGKFVAGMSQFEPPAGLNL